MGITNLMPYPPFQNKNYKYCIFEKMKEISYQKFPDEEEYERLRIND